MTRRQTFNYRWLGWIFLLAYIVTVSVLFRNAVASPVSNGLAELQAGRVELIGNTPSAQQHFAAASRDFDQALANLRATPAWAKIATPLPPARWYVRLIKSLSRLASAGQAVTQLVTTLPAKPTRFEPDTFLVQGTNNYLGWYSSNRQRISHLEEELEIAQTDLDAVPGWVLFSRQRESELHTTYAQLSTARASLKKLNLAEQQIEEAFGSTDSTTHTFLILFQNDAELRPSGGFLGSYAVLTAGSGRLHSFAMGENIYTLDKNFLIKANTEMSKAGITQPDLKLIDQKEPAFVSSRTNPFKNQFQIVYNPPIEYRTLAAEWTFHDSNANLPFRNELFSQVADFYALASGVKPEGIIALDTSVLEDVLSLSGPVVLPGVTPVTVTAATVRTALTEEVEKNYWLEEANRAANNPKDIIGKFFPELMKAVISRKVSPTALASLGQRAIERKSIQFWSANDGLNQTLASWQPADQASPSGNWLKIVNSNLGGLKSSIHVSQDVKATVTGSWQSGVTVDVTIRRTHSGSGQWPDGRNVNFMQVYLPSTATVTVMPSPAGEIETPANLQKKYGIADRDWTPWITTGPGWKRINLWATTEVGASTVYHFTYRLPAGSQTHLTLIPQAGQKVGTVDIAQP